MIIWDNRLGDIWSKSFPSLLSFLSMVMYDFDKCAISLPKLGSNFPLSGSADTVPLGSRFNSVPVSMGVVDFFIIASKFGY